ATLREPIAWGPVGPTAVEVTATVDCWNWPSRPAATLAVTFRVPMLPARTVELANSPTVTDDRAPAVGVAGLSAPIWAPPTDPPTVSFLMPNGAITSLAWMVAWILPATERAATPGTPAPPPAAVIIPAVTSPATKLTDGFSGWVNPVTFTVPSVLAA